MTRLTLCLLLAMLPAFKALSQAEPPELNAPHRVARVVPDGQVVRANRPPVEVALTSGGYLWARLVLQAPVSSSGSFMVFVTDRSGLVLATISSSEFELTADGSIVFVTEQLTSEFGRVSVTGSGAMVTIAQVVRGTATVSVETTVEGLILSSIASQNAAVAAASRAVVLLEYSDGDIRRCNAVLLTPDIIATNSHCIGRRSIVEALYYPRVYPDFATESRPGVLVRVAELLDTNVKLDVSLLKLKTPLTSRNPVAIRKQDPTKGQDLRVIQFYEGRGWQKVVSADVNCKVRLIYTEGSDGFTQSDFYHGCDTEKGSSGTAVFDISGGFAGLHRVGSNPGFWNDNKAVATSRIAQWITDLKIRKPVVFGAISVIP